MSSAESGIEYSVVNRKAHRRLVIQHAQSGHEVISFASVGQGTPVLVLSPYLVPLRTQWDLGTSRRFIRKLAETHRVLLIDDRHAIVGRSEADQPVPDDYLSELVVDVISVLNAAGVDRCHVIGSLHTTMPIVATAARHPERVASLLLWDGLLDGATSGSDEGVPELTGLISGPNIDVATPSFIGALGIVGDAKVNEEQRQLLIALRDQPVLDRVAVRGLLASNVRLEAGSVQCRTLVVVPERAVLPGRGLTEELAGSIPGARLIRTRGAAVGPCLDDHAVSIPLVLDWLREVAGESGGPVPDVRLTALTPRELEICRQIALGQTNVEIAEALTISRWTVQRHVSNAIRKTGAANRAELAAMITGHRSAEV